MTSFGRGFILLFQEKSLKEAIYVIFLHFSSNQALKRSPMVYTHTHTGKFGCEMSTIFKTARHSMAHLDAHQHEVRMALEVD